VYKHIVIQRDDEEALAAIGLMGYGLIVDLSMEIAILAADLSVEHKLPMADSIILATARKYRATLWTQDEHFKVLPDVKFVTKK
ncbi:MAG: type II toxin-antitoxin system VapC family toxin, partial [Chloroflexi bacterium]